MTAGRCGAPQSFSGERFAQPRDAGVEPVVRDGEREPRPAAAAHAEALAGGERDVVLREQRLRRDALRESQPDVVAPLAAGRVELRPCERGEDAVAARLVEVAA